MAKRHIKRIAVILIPGVVFLCLTGYMLDRLFPLPELPQYSTEIYAADGTLQAAFLTPDDKWRMHATLDEIDSFFLETIIFKEDRWFYYHPGFNPVAIVRAAVNNLRGKGKAGASTITMQVARMLEPKPRTYPNKLVEMFRALQLEWHFTKDEILALYCNLLPFGGNIEGVKAAAYIYFNRPPAQLSTAQAVALALIPNNPNHLRIDRGTDALKQKRDAWLNYLSQQTMIPEAERIIALQEPLKPARHPVSRNIPHLAWRLQQQYPGRKVHTTIEMSVQQNVEEILLRHIQQWRENGITNGAVLVVDNRTHAVIAYCGSADFHDAANGGQIDGVTTLRSPGSTLKPFLYTYAFDRGMLTPLMRLPDVPTSLNGFIPENFSGTYHGSVTVKEALAESLNVPAVRLLYQTGTDRFISLLSTLGFEWITGNRNKLGLSLITGGCAVTLEELTHAYTALANDGVLYPVCYVNDDKRQPEAMRVFSAAACYMTLSILEEAAIASFESYNMNHWEHPPFVWKTGTSYAKKDAWAVGVSPEYTVGVWTGNFNGRGAPQLIGSVVAVPLLRDVFNTLDQTPGAWFTMPFNLYEREVCSFSGMVPTAACTQHDKDFYIARVSNATPCDQMITWYGDSTGTISYCPACLPLRYRKYQTHQPPGEVLAWLRTTGLDVTQVPVHNPGCPGHLDSPGPQIISPSPDFEYFVDVSNDQSMALKATSHTDDWLYWYVDGRLAGKTRSGEQLFVQPPAGKIPISCMDGKGRVTRIFVTVHRM